MKFSDLDLKPEILTALTDMGYQDLTPIQEQTFSHILSGRDLLARAETGSGKTMACGIPLVQMIDPSLNAIQALILVPTRELALQYVEEIDKISRLDGGCPLCRLWRILHGDSKGQVQGQGPYPRCHPRAIDRFPLQYHVDRPLSRSHAGSG